MRSIEELLQLYPPPDWNITLAFGAFFFLRHPPQLPVPPHMCHGTDFSGGMGHLFFGRYSGPVPYSEIIYCPGNYRCISQEGKVEQWPRLPVMFVDQEFPAHLGRRYCGMPKRMARFEWEESAHGRLHLKVWTSPRLAGSSGGSRLSAEEELIFEATAQRLAPALLPIDSRWAPPSLCSMRRTVHPTLDENFKPGPQLVGTDLEMRGWAQPVWLSEVKHVSTEHFPDLKRVPMCPVGMGVRDCALEVRAGEPYTPAQLSDGEDKKIS